MDAIEALEMVKELIDIGRFNDEVGLFRMGFNAATKLAVSSIDSVIASLKQKEK